MGKSTGAVPELPPHTLTILDQFLKDRLASAGGGGFVIGLSGGLDSAVVAALCAGAVGPEKVLALSMPSRRVASTGLAADWARSLNLGYQVVLLDELYKSVSSTLEPVMDASRELRKEGLPKEGSQGGREETLANALARLRMVVLYAAAQSRGYLVAGTSNKSELLLGYYTKWGDGASDVAPLGDLYKTQVRQLAGELEVLPAILEAPPSAELFEGQTDEADLGMSYDTLDRVLWGLERKLEQRQVAKMLGIPLPEVQRIAQTLRRTVHKRKLPLIPKLGLRTVGLDWREVVR